ncbi:hypothetical protein A2U01_0071886, partial [Trifolium medium]|nr:hypothetical protein [Trifolium medium]
MIFYGFISRSGRIGHDDDSEQARWIHREMEGHEEKEENT